MKTPPVFKRGNILLLFLFISGISIAQISSSVNIPDQNFEQALIDLGIDSDGIINQSVLIDDIAPIEVLDVSNKNISSLEGIQSFQNLKYLYAYNNQVATIDVSANTGLIHLSLNNNQLTSLDITNNSLLEELHINNNQISSLSLGNHPDLIRLHAGGNQITSLDLSGLPILNSLILWGSELTSIDLSSNVELVELVLDDNNLSSLDVSGNPKLEFLFASNNQLTSLNIANGNNFNFTSPDWNDYSLVVQGNPDLNCIQVDGDLMGNIPNDWAKDFEAIYSSDCALKPEYVHIPDASFEQALIDLGIDSDQALNSWLLLSDAESVTNLNLRLPVSFPYGGGNTMITNVTSTITDLTGIEAFINLEDLLLDSNDLENLDLSKLSKLSTLRCSNNNLTQIALNQNSELKYLFLTGNALTQIDVTNNPKLEELEINNNQVSQIDVSQNSLLKTLEILGNPISTLDTSNLFQLVSLYCGRTNIATLDLSNNLALKELNVDELPISEIDLSIYPDFERLWARNTSLENLDFSKNPKLLQVWIEYSPIKTLDLSNNPALFELVLDNNPALEHLDLRNGNNAAINFFRLNNTPNLTCINADENISEAMTASGKSFSTNCGDFVEIPDPNFEQALIDLGIDSDGIVNEQILRTDALAITGVLNVSYKNISDLTGIEAFVNITKLYCQHNQISSIDLSNNSELTLLAIWNNQLSTIDLTSNFKFKDLYADNNSISSLTFAESNLIERINLRSNPISELDFSAFPNLFQVDIAYSNISSVDFTQNSALGEVYLSGLELESIDISKNLNLKAIDLSGNNVSVIDLSNNSGLSYFYASNCSLLSNLDFRNGNNSNVTTFVVNNSPNLTCVNADSVVSQAMIESGKSFSTDCGDFVEIPDPNFEQALIDIGIDSDGVLNGKLLRSDAVTVEELNLTNPKVASDPQYANAAIVNVEGKITDLTGIGAFVNLKDLSAMSNALTGVDISNNTLLQQLNLVDNQISSIDVSQNSNLELLWLESNNLSQIDVSNNPNLLNIALGYNNISVIDISQNNILEVITIESNDLSTIDVSNNLELQQIWVADNPNFTNIDLSKNSKLFGIGIYDTSITSLDLSNNPLIRLYIGNNPELEHLDLRNGNNQNLTQFWAGNTPKLSCINADASTSQEMKNSGKSFSEDCGDFIYIPDPNFEQALIDLGIDSDGVVNTSILHEDAAAVTDLNLNNPIFDNSAFANPEIVNVDGKIADLTGIEAFVNLKNLQAAYGALTEVDLSANTQLEELFLNDNQLSGVEVSKLANLKRFGVMRNPLAGSVDLSGNPALEELFIHYTGISSIDLSANTNLWNLFIQNNNLTALDLSSNTALRQVSVQHNQLSELDITLLSIIERVDAQYNSNLTLVTGANGNPSLNSLNLSGTGLTNFNGVLYPNLEWLLLNDNSLSNFNGNNNLKLLNLFLNNNGITKLGLNFNPQLVQLQVMNNGLEELDLRNGNNASLTTMEATGNLLTCISVDDPLDQTMPYPTWEFDPGIVLSQNCKKAEEVVLIPDPNFEQSLIDQGIDTNGLTGNILLSDAEAATSLNVSNRAIENATGLKAFTNIESLNISDNSLTEIDLTENTSLTSIDVSGNALAELFISSGNKLIELYASGNGLTQVNLRDLSNLEKLDISGNIFESLDLSEFRYLGEIDVSNNNLTGLDLRNGNNTAITLMDATNNPFLQCIGVDDSSNIPSGWSIDLTSSYTNSGDCDAPTVITKDIVVYLDRYGLASISPQDIDNGSTDNVSPQKNLTYDLNISEFDCGNMGDNEVNLIVTDESGNIGSGTANVEVKDEIVPEVSSMRSITLDLNGSASVGLAPADVDDGSTDNCSGNLLLSIDQSSFSFPGNYEVTFTVTDGSGNTASSITSVEVVDSASNPTTLKFKGNLVVTVYPNPFSDHFVLAFSKPVDLNLVDAKVYNLLGGLTGVDFHQEGDVLISDNAGQLAGSNTEYSLLVTINGQTQSALIIKE